MNRALIRSILAALGVAGFTLLAPTSVLRADELKLKDGTKIVGTIVGFEENSFKVKTSYGFAVIEKDHVLSISVSDAADEPDKATKKDESSREKPAAVKAKGETTSPAASSAARANLGQAKPSPEVSSSAATDPPAAPAAAPALPAVASVNRDVAPVKPPEPEPIREEVAGNTYTNETYRFHMYKPPDWEVIRAANTILPGAIAAMGTDDEMTYLLIGQQPAGQSLATDTDSAEKRLQSAMEHFRRLDERRLTVGGVSVTARHFRGSVDDHDWSGVIVLIPHGSRVYTVFGMTRADSDLVQIQENVISRAIASLEFND